MTVNGVPPYIGRIRRAARFGVRARLSKHLTDIVTELPMVIGGQWFRRCVASMTIFPGLPGGDRQVPGLFDR